MANRQTKLIVILFSLALLGLMLAIVGNFWGPAFGPELGAVPLTQIESGKVGQSRYYAQVSGYADRRMAVFKMAKKGIVYYIPLRSTTDSTAPVHLILTCQEREMASCTAPQGAMIAPQGYVQAGGDGKFENHRSGREQLMQQGIQLARRVNYINCPGDRDNARLTMLILGGVVLSGIFSMFQGRGAR
jgi:hypothetical protein